MFKRHTADSYHCNIGSHLNYFTDSVYPVAVQLESPFLHICISYFTHDCLHE